jgi:chemotaxis signal transduction protein
MPHIPGRLTIISGAYMAKYKSIEIDDELAGLMRHMNAVEEYREILQNLQAVWDNLTLLGQLSGAGTELSSTRQAFGQLTSRLLNQLGGENLKKAVQEMKAQAQVAIDILVRNLFERTADIGFLATDEDIRRYIASAGEKSSNIHSLKELEAEREALRRRFAEYVAKYSVYSDVILLDTQGRVLARHDESVDVEISADPIVREALTTPNAFVESYREHDFRPGYSTLVYAYRVTDAAGENIGALCLCFRLGSEVASIFGKLRSAGDWSVITLLDQDGTVVASSDRYYIPLGAKLEMALDCDYRIVRFGGNEYLATTQPTQGYQGYQGPGWYGHAMLPVAHAFNKEVSHVLRGVAPAVLSAVMSDASMFGEQLRLIPQQAQAVQADLNRSVWNGNVRLGANNRTSPQAANQTFAKTLLWEISNTGAKTQDVFERSIANLNETVISMLLQNSRFLASLAIDIMDRNLYERANDCRWWALTTLFREKLAQEALNEEDVRELEAVLAYINGLYTVYSNLVLFDGEGRFVAASRPQAGLVRGSIIHEAWVRETLTAQGTQQYTVSDFTATPLYEGRHTYIYAAAIHAPAGAPGGDKVVGGIGIVFDSAPQFEAMLKDALPRDSKGYPMAGAYAIFSDLSGRVIACSDDHYRPGAQLPQSDTFRKLASGEAQAAIIQKGDRYYAVGGCHSTGYREYKSAQDCYHNEVLSFVLQPLCEIGAAQNAQPPAPPRLRPNRGAEGGTLEIATFNVGRGWFGLPADAIVEAVDPVGISDVPGSGEQFCGYLMFRNEPIPVYDIIELLNAGTHQPDAQRQVVIIRKSSGACFGFVVDGLGEIPEIARSRLQALPPMLAGGNVLGEMLVRPEEGAEQKDDILMVLGADRIAARLGVIPLNPDNESVIAIDVNRPQLGNAVGA